MPKHKLSKATTEIPKTRDTNCQVEMWFWIVKHSILQKKKYLRPADFIHKMYGSLQGRYKEHIIQNNLPDTLITDKPPAITGLDQAEEQWAKRDKNDGTTKRKSKYFETPKKIPIPKKGPRRSKGPYKATQTMPAVSNASDSLSDSTSKIAAKVLYTFHYIHFIYVEDIFILSGMITVISGIFRCFVDDI